MNKWSLLSCKDIQPDIMYLSTPKPHSGIYLILSKLLVFFIVILASLFFFVFFFTKNLMIVVI